MPYRKRAGLDSSKRMYKDAEAKRQNSVNTIQGLSNQLKGQIDVMERADQIWDRNEGNALQDWIEAYGSWVQGKRKETDAIVQLGTGLLQEAGKANARKREAETQRGYDTFPTDITAPVPFTREAVGSSPSFEQGINVLKDVNLSEGIDSSNFSSVEEKVNFSENQNKVGAITQTAITSKDNINSSLLLQTSFLTDSAQGTKVYENYLTSTEYNLNEKRGGSFRLVENLTRFYNDWEANTTKPILIKINGEYREVIPAELSIRNGTADSSIANEDYAVKLQLYNYFVDNEFIPSLNKHVGESYTDTYLIGAINKQAAKFGSEYRLKWAAATNQKHIVHATGVLKTKLREALAARNHPDFDSLALLNSKHGIHIKEFQILAERMNRLGVEGYSNPKGKGVELYISAINDAIEELPAEEQDEIMKILDGATIPHKLVSSLISKKEADAKGNVLLSKVFPEKWSGDAFRLALANKETTELNNQKTINQGLLNRDINDLKEQMIAGTLSRKKALALAQNIKATHSGKLGIENGDLNNLLDKVDIMRTGSNGYNWAISKITANGKLTDADLLQLDDTVHALLKEQYKDEWHYDKDGILEKVSMYEQVSSAVKENVIKNLTSALPKGTSAKAILNRAQLIEKIPLAIQQEIREINRQGGQIGSDPEKLLLLAQGNILKQMQEAAGMDRAQAAKAPPEIARWWPGGFTKDYPHKDQLSNIHIPETSRTDEVETHTVTILDMLERYDKGVIGNPLWPNTRFTKDMKGSSQLYYELNADGEMHDIWYELAKHPLNVAVNGYKPTAADLRLAFYKANKDQWESMAGINLAEPLSATESIDDLRARLSPAIANKLQKNISNQKQLIRILAGAKNNGGPLYGTSQNAVSNIPVTDRLQWRYPDAVKHWDKTILPDAIEWVSKAIKNPDIAADGHPAYMGRVAIAMFYGLIDPKGVTQIDPATMLPQAFSDPRVKEWVRRSGGRSLEDLYQNN